MRSLFVATALLLCAGLQQSAVAGAWEGGYARVKDAEAACTDTRSRACQPYLAVANGIVMLLTYQAISKDDGKTLQIPAHASKMVTCPVSLVDKLNALTLFHLTLANGAPPDEDWDEALLRSVYSLCEPKDSLPTAIGR
jgi:hypothetical protein